ncbi:MAG: PilZ domain-containing protein [Candidatus Omnitrophota bacterium]|jgi:c-di-GMP-binding flagellar brake protein YcgR
MAAEGSNQDKTNTDRRRYVRVDIFAVTRYFCPVREREVGVQTRISDISEGGMKLMTFDEGIPVDAEVTIYFAIPASEGAKERQVGIIGQIRHTGLAQDDVYRSGLEFVRLDESNRTAIRDYVAAKLKTSGPSA